MKVGEGNTAQRSGPQQVGGGEEGEPPVGRRETRHKGVALSRWVAGRRESRLWGGGKHGTKEWPSGGGWRGGGRAACGEEGNTAQRSGPQEVGGGEEGEPPVGRRETRHKGVALSRWVAGRRESRLWGGGKHGTKEWPSGGGWRGGGRAACGEEGNTAQRSGPQEVGGGEEGEPPVGRRETRHKGVALRRWVAGRRESRLWGGGKHGTKEWPSGGGWRGGGRAACGEEGNTAQRSGPQQVGGGEEGEPPVGRRETRHKGVALSRWVAGRRESRLWGGGGGGVLTCPRSTGHRQVLVYTRIMSGGGKFGNVHHLVDKCTYPSTRLFQVIAT